MKQNYSQKNGLWLFFWLLLIGNILAGCNGSSSSNSSSTTTPVVLGTLPNGGQVSVSSASVPVSSGGTGTVTMTLTGGSAGAYAMNFNTTSSQSTKTGAKATLDANSSGITTETNPTPCVLGTGVSGVTSSCSINILVSANTPAGTYQITPTAVAVDGSTTTTLSPITVLVSAPSSSSSKAILSFSLNGFTGVISGQSINVTVPFGTDVSNLVASYVTTGASVSVNGTLQVNGSTANNFSKPLSYVVTAVDGSTATNIVTVTVAASSANNITAYSINGVAGVISGTDIAVTLPFGSSVNDLIATFTTDGESVTVSGVPQVSGVTQNNFSAPVTYNVTAANGNVKQYLVTVLVAADSANSITEFALNGYPGLIANQAILVTVPFGTDVTSMVATYTTSGVSVSVDGVPQVSGVTANDFTNPVTYSVTAANGDVQKYLVEVQVAANSDSSITAYSIHGQQGTIIGNVINVTLPFATDVTALIADFTTNAHAVFVGTTPQVSGQTPNDFTNPVTYKTVADDTSSQEYTVNVALAANNAKEFTSYSINGNSGIIDDQAGTINVTVPYGTNPIALIAKFTTTGKSVTAAVTVAGTTINVPQISGVSPNSFISPVIYTITAADKTTRDYTVTVTVGPADGNLITAYSLIGSSGKKTEGKIDGTNIYVTMPWSTNPNFLIATFSTNAEKVTVGKTITIKGHTKVIQIPQFSGYSPNNFANSLESPVVYTVTAVDGSTNTYKVYVSVVPEAMTSFTLYDLTGLGIYPGTIDGDQISVKVPFGTTNRTFRAAFDSTGLLVLVKFIPQINLVSENDFTNPVVYTVFALPFNTAKYTVTVSEDAPPVNALTAYSINVNGTDYPGVISSGLLGNTIVVDLPKDTGLNGLVANFTTTGTKVTATSFKFPFKTTTQVSGVTPNDYSTTFPLIYQVSGGSDPTTTYSVTVKYLP